MSFLTKSFLFFLAISFLNGCVPVIPAGASTAATAVSADNDRRSTGELIDDKSLHLRLFSWLLENESAKKSNISLLIYKKNVLVAGQTPNAADKSNILGKIQSDFPEINRVIDEISITKNNSLVGKAKDISITALVEANLLNQEVVNPTHVRVMTESGVVYLMGDVTKREADAAVKSASKANGVKSIIKHFNYLTTRPEAEILKEKQQEELKKAEQLKKLSEKEKALKREELLKQLRELGGPEGTPF